MRRIPPVKLLSFGWLAVVLFALAPGAHASSSDDPNPPIVALGDNTYVITRGSTFRYFLGTSKLVLRARADAEKFCHDQGKEMRELSAQEITGSLLLGDLSKAKITFKALTPGDPGLTASGAAPSNGSDLTKLEDLHHSGVLADSEFDAAKKRVAERSLEELQDLHNKGVLSDSEFEAARKRLNER